MKKNISSRRKFMRIMTAALPASFLANFSVNASSAKSPMKKVDGTFRHHVYFWLKNPDSNEDRKLFMKNLTNFLKEVEVILSVHVGEPAGTPRDVVDNSYQYDLLVNFKNKEDQDIYQEHPAHIKFVDDTAHLWAKVQVYDSISVWPE
ncbi:MAG: Dabb family protein [Bacteroidota bacterium]